MLHGRLERLLLLNRLLKLGMLLSKTSVVALIVEVTERSERFGREHRAALTDDRIVRRQRRWRYGRRPSSDPVSFRRRNLGLLAVLLRGSATAAGSS